MSAYNIGVIIISDDSKYRLSLTNSLKKYTEIDVIDNVFSIVHIKPILKKNKLNVIIIDTDSIDVSEQYLRMLLDEFNIKIIIVGNHNNIHLSRLGIKDILRKQNADNTIIWDIYIKNIYNRIKSIGNNLDTKNMDNTGLSITTNTKKIIMIASSTGGTEALPQILYKLPSNMPPILIVQHMPAIFTAQFANRLNRQSKINIKEAENGDCIINGTALIAPGDYHMRIVKKASSYIVETYQGEKIHGVRPAADILFYSALEVLSPQNIIGVILTGMGADGAMGLYELHKKGATIIAQDKRTSIVYGMPKVAYELGAVDYVLPLDKIAEKLIELAK